ncbi:hypothetical protein PsYK624_078540 [Phanerochaete sordida]|uniref:Uncharacterized protein n=1 Tax=Phanerochaete sordida TaxID=48140 RepID=A0A9P3LEK5_9APHY|nr:hypothetical protein PsYK624_078540 [Phanerochaete sordida]
MPKWNGTLAKMSSSTSPLRKLVLISPAVDATNDFSKHAWTFPQLEELDSAFSLGSSLAVIASSTLKRLVLPSTDLRSLADALRKMPLLEELHVALRDSIVGSTMSLPLYSLRSLRLIGEADHCAALFRLLELPQDVRIAISPSGVQGPVTAFPVALGNMPDILQQLVSCTAGRPGSLLAPVVSLDIAFSAEGCRISGWRRVHVLPQSRTLAGPSPDVRLGISSDAAIGDAATLLSSLGALQGLQVLHIHLLPHVDAFLPFMRRLSTIAGLRVLVLDSVPLVVVLELVAITTAKELWLLSIDFSNGQSVTNAGAPNGTNSQTSWLDLIETCSLRAVTGQGFSSIMVDGRKEVTQNVVAMLSELPDTDVDFLADRPPECSRTW